MRLKTIILVFCCLFFGNVWAAEKEVYETVRVTGEIKVNTKGLKQSFQELEEEARQLAKREAIVKVCGEQISIWDRAENSASGESFNSLTLNSSMGEIVDFEILEENSMQSPVNENMMIFYCKAKVKVKKGGDADPNFKAKVEGIKSLYHVDELLKFTVTPFRDCYLKIFCIASGIGGLLYPNADYDEVFEMKASKKYAFPVLKEMDYPIEKNAAVPVEKTELLFVFTKDEYPFNISTNQPQDIERWVAGIPNNQKYIEIRVFDVK